MFEDVHRFFRRHSHHKFPARSITASRTSRRFSDSPYDRPALKHFGLNRMLSASNSESKRADIQTVPSSRDDSRQQTEQGMKSQNDKVLTSEESARRL